MIHTSCRSAAAVVCCHKHTTGVALGGYQGAPLTCQHTHVRVTPNEVGVGGKQNARMALDTQGGTRTNKYRKEERRRTPGYTPAEYAPSIMDRMDTARQVGLAALLTM